MNRNRKPVRKCRGCDLNFHDHCGLYDNPHEMWHNRRRCPGYMNEELLAEYQAREAKLKADAPKQIRKAVAGQRRSEPHHNGDRHVFVAGKV